MCMELFTALIRYEIDLWNTVDGALRDRGRISLAQLQAVEIVDRLGGEARVLDVSTQIGITIGAASKLVDRLERDALAVRTPNPVDRRSSLIGLTTSGRAALREATAVRDDVLRGAIGADIEQAALAVIADLQRRLDAYREQVSA